MEIKTKLLSFLGAAMMVACSSATASDGYKVNVSNLPEESNGLTLFIVNFDNGEKVDSVTVENGSAFFSGSVEEPIPVRFVIDGSRKGNFILENADITIDAQKGASSPLNDKQQAIYDRMLKIREEAQALPDDSTSMAKMEELQRRYEGIADSAMMENIDNVIGYGFFLNKAYSMTYEELESFLKEHPQLKKYKRVNDLLTALQRKAATQPGNKYVDFTIVNDSTEQKLSDYVGNGKLTLVDFWASWCGPCIRETKVLKELYNEYANQGLEILGVAVWDEPENTLAAIEQHQLPWKHIINAQTIPTDLYGISCIPCIILIAPDGTILSRDKQDQDLVDDVRAALNGTLTPDSVRVAK